MMVVPGRIETVVKQFGVGQRSRRSQIVHRLAQQKRICYNLFAA